MVGGTDDRALQLQRAFRPVARASNSRQNYSLFQGSTTSDTAVFKPFRENTAATLTFSREQNPFAVLTKLFGRSVPVAEHAPVAPVDPNMTPEQQAQAREMAGAAGRRRATGR